jgi:hypothetical protein
MHAHRAPLQGQWQRGVDGNGKVHHAGWGAAVLHHALVEGFAEHFQMAGIQARQRAVKAPAADLVVYLLPAGQICGMTLGIIEMANFSQHGGPPDAFLRWRPVAGHLCF